MSLGTLSETRPGAKPQTMENKIANPPVLESATAVVPADKPPKNTPDVVQTMVTTTADTGLVNKPAPTAAPAQATIVMEQPTKKPCAYCTAKSVTGIAFQISAVILLLAISFHLVKKV